MPYRSQLRVIAHRLCRVACTGSAYDRRADAGVEVEYEEALALGKNDVISCMDHRARHQRGADFERDAGARRRSYRRSWRDRQRRKAAVRGR